MAGLVNPSPSVALLAGAEAEAGTEAGWLKVQEAILANQKAQVTSMTASVSAMGDLTKADAAKIAGMNDQLSDLKAKADASAKADADAKNEGNKLAARATANIETLRSMLIDKLELSAKKAAVFHDTFTTASNLLEKVQTLANQCTEAELSFMSLSKEVTRQQGTITVLTTSLTSQIAAFESSKVHLGAANTALSGAEADQSAANTALAGAEAAKATATADNADATAALAGAESANADANAANADAAGKLSGAESANSDANTANADASAALDTATGAEAQAGAEAKLAADELAKSVAKLTDVNTRKAAQLSSLKESIQSRLSILKQTVASKNAQMELLSGLQTEMKSTMEDMRVMISTVKTSIITMESMGMMDIFAPKTTIAGSDDCPTHADASIPNPPGYCVKAGRSISDKAALAAVTAELIAENDFLSGRIRRMAFWTAAFKTPIPGMNMFEMWSGMTTGNKCWDPTMVDREQCGFEDPYYAKAPTPPSTQMAFKVTGECVSPYSTANDNVQLGDKAAGAIDGRINKIGMSKEEIAKVAANMKRILGNQEQKMTKAGDDTDEEALRGTCYDRVLMKNLKRAVSGLQQIMASADGVDDAIAQAKAGGEAVDAAVAGAEAATSSLRFKKAAPAGSEAAKVDPKTIVDAICKDAGSLAELISAAGDRTAAMITYIEEVGKIITATNELKVTLTKRLQKFDGHNEMIKEYRTSNSVMLEKCRALEIKLGDMLGANEAAIAAAKKKTDEANAAAAAANAGAAAATSDANALNADTAGKVADTTALDGKTADTNADTAGKVADATALDKKTADTNADTAGKVADTATLDASTTALNAQASSDTSGATSNNAESVSGEAKILTIMGEIGIIQQSITTLETVSKKLNETMVDAKEQYTWLKEDFEGASQSFGPFIQIFDFCNKLKCYDKCRAAPDKWPVMGTCDGTEAINDLIGAGPGTNPPQDNGNGIWEVPVPEAIFRLNAFGCAGDKVAWYNPKPTSWTKPCVDSTNLYECMDPKYVDTFKSEIANFGTAVLKIALKALPGRVGINLQIKGYFAGGAGRAASQSMQDRSLCRAKLIKKIINAEGRKAFGVMAKADPTLTEFPDLESWICVTSSKQCADSAKTTGVVALKDKAICA
jgi:hypothetical protein